jgi:hypothetical protein
VQRTWYIGNSREKLLKVLAALAHFLVRPEDDYEIVIREHRKARSIAQNRYYWALLNELARHEVQGQRFITEAWHEYFKGRFIGKEEIKLPNGQIFNRPISTTTLDVGQFAEYVTQIEAWAAGHGILLGGEEVNDSDRIEMRRAA